MASDRESLSATFEVLYRELRALAALRMRREWGVQSIRATELVHEAFVRLSADRRLRSIDKAELLAIAGTAMRRILVDRARRRRSLKRGGELIRVTIDESVGFAADETSLDVLALNEALETLEELDPEAAEVVQSRFFAGMTVPEVAKAMGRSDRWVHKKWRFARAWLNVQMSGEAPTKQQPRG